MRVKHRLLSLSAIAVAVPIAALASPPAAVSATTFVNWPAYLDGPAHSSYNAAANAFTPANSGTLTHD